MDKRMLLLPALLCVLFAFTPAAFATTTVNFTWDGSGSISHSMNTGDADFNFTAQGGHIFGSLKATDYDDNPYGYGVDTFLVETRSHFESGGLTVLSVARDDSWTPMYGPADESSYSYVSSDDTGDIQFRVWTNYAQLRSSNYGFQANQQFTATGNFEVEHTLTNGNNWGDIYAVGEGSISIDHMSDDTFVSTFKFGFGCGCYTNSDATGTGSGVFTVTAHGDSGLYGSGWSTSGSSDYIFGVAYSDGFSASNYWVGG